MASIFFYILLGALQGLLEWLPVSSEGQLVLVVLWFSDLNPQIAISLAFWLHFGTMTAVLVVYRHEWKKILDLRIPDTDNVRSFILYSTLGTAVVGVPIQLFLLDRINSEKVALVFMWIIGISLLITGTLIQFSRKDNSKNIRKLSELSKREQFLIGAVQGVAIIPGISRSGSTVSALLFRKVDSEDAFRGSFLMSVPAVMGAIVLDVLISIVYGETLFENLSVVGIIAAIIASFVFGILSIHVLIYIAKKYNFAIIAYILGLLIILVLVL